MDIPHMNSYEEQAVDALVTIVNQAKSQLNIRQNLFQLANSRNEFTPKAKVSLHKLESPLVKNSEQLIVESIEKKWKLTDVFKYIHRFMGSSVDETAHYLYYEVVFSQPTVAYPIPQATVSVFFRVQHKHLEPAEFKKSPQMTFRIEGQHTDHDVHDVMLTADWILATLQMKINVFKKIENIALMYRRLYL